MAHNEKWERTKQNLFRNLLEDPGYRLSPVTEESVSDDLVSRPYSPLPDLVIEPEPNRHDDPPEFYQELAVRTRRLYKRLMEDRESEGLINIEKDISENNVDHHISHHGLLESYQATTTKSDPEICNTNNMLKEIQNISEENKDKSAEDISPVISPIISYGSKNKSNQTKLTELDMDLTNVISTTENESKLCVSHNTSKSIKTKDGQSKQEPINEVNKDSEKSQESSEDSEDFFAFLEDYNAGTDAVSASKGTFASDKSSSQGRKIFQNMDECVSDNSFEVAMRKEAFVRISKRKTFYHSSELESETEEINDHKEYYQHITNDDDSDIDSFEIAMCRKTFQRRTRQKRSREFHRKKGFGPSSGELQSVSEDEEVEEMRGAPLTDPLQAFKRRSTASQESLLGTFAKPSVAEIHEDTSLVTSCKSPEARDDGCLSEECSGMKSPVLGTSSTQTYKDLNCQGGMSIDNEEQDPLQSGIDIEEDSKAQNSPDSHNTDDISENKPTKSVRFEVRESSVGTEEATTSAPKDNVMSTLCDEIWSVSPIPINTSDFSPVTPRKVVGENVPTKRRQKFCSDIPKKRKKYQDKAVQTSNENDPNLNIRQKFCSDIPNKRKKYQDKAVQTSNENDPNLNINININK